MFGDKFRGLTRDELPLPIAPLTASLLGSLKSLGNAHLRGKKRGKRKVQACSWDPKKSFVTVLWLSYLQAIII